LRPFSPLEAPTAGVSGTTRAELIARRVLALDHRATSRQLRCTLSSLGRRHRDITARLERRFQEVNGTLFDRITATEEQSLLIAAYFFAEYSFEAAALFNPSMVVHPDQSGVAPGAVRFVMSLRSIGEGHMSSVTFRTGQWSERDGFALDACSPQATTPEIEVVGAGDATEIRLSCSDHEDLSETVLFPVTEAQHRGVEDLRLVRFVDEDGAVDYFGTYTAFDGVSARSEFLQADNFRNFVMRPLTGDAVGKGMALFPSKIEGRYAMLGRCDGESISLLRSPDRLNWASGTEIISPRYPWEFFQLGNCGSPILIDEGWLVLTHGVGPVRDYSIGACLLDRRDPLKLLGRMPAPLLEPRERERDGYVPNVVYSCGAMVHDRRLLISYGVADSFTSFATIQLDKLLAAME
jgi:predicted GH43/DUF377 family glycosyl hydrolase